MKTMQHLIKFIGGIRFAIALIATVALFVMAGTFIESRTESHQYASLFTYGNPLFIALLWGFFVNILISALRRWPFQMRHIPFLTTHLGLLMILAGALYKSYAGIQGNMSIIEGSASQEIFLPYTYAVKVEKKDEVHADQRKEAYYALHKSLSGRFNPDLKEDNHPFFPELKMKLVAYAPHSSSRMETWIKGDMGVISGIKPFPVYDWKQLDPQSNLPVSTRIRLPQMQDKPWQVLALRTPDRAESAKRAYLEGLDLFITDSFNQTILYQGSLTQAIAAPIKWAGGEAKVELSFESSQEKGLMDPFLNVTFHLNESGLNASLQIPLSGDESLKNLNEQSVFFGGYPIAFDLLRKEPRMVLLQDLHGDDYFLAFDLYGRVHVRTYRPAALDSLIVYDQGFGGYAVPYAFPFTAHLNGRLEREQVELSDLMQQIRQGLQTASLLSPPLQLFQTASQKAGVDFVENFTTFLSIWNRHHGWLYPNDLLLSESIAEVMNQLDWKNGFQSEQKAALWASALFAELEGPLVAGSDVLQLLEERGWPLIAELRPLKTGEGFCTAQETAVILTTLTQQLFKAANQLPDMLPHAHPLSPETQAHLFSAYLRAYSLHLSDLQLPNSSAEREVNSSEMALETPLTLRVENQIPNRKLEDNVPKITLLLTQGERSELVTLAYDPIGQGLKWPIFDGEYLLRFQPKVQTIPYRLRLRQARQINYANSLQPYSFESDLLISDGTEAPAIEKTISMNHVYETWEGYRFYLSNIAPPNEGAVKHVQIIVNHDPGKYWLTYPGAMLLTLGIILLFWMKPYAFLKK